MSWGEQLVDGVTTAVEHLRRGVSLEIVGRPGSGRSRLLESIAARLDAQAARTVRVHGVGAMSGRPLGSLVASLRDIGKHPTIGECVAYLERKAAASGILLVDDADDLDDVSAGVLAALRTRTAVPFVVARRTGSRSEPLRKLLASLQPSLRHEVPPLTFGQLRDLLESDVGAPIDSETMARIATMSGRLPGLARAIALVGGPSGDHWAADPSLWPGELGQTIEALLVDAGDDDIDALTLLAVGGQLSVRDAHELVPAERIERLNELGLVDFIDGPRGGTVGLYPPVVGEYLRRSCTSAKRAAIRRLLRAKHLTLPCELLPAEHPALPIDSALLSRSMSAHWSAVARERLAAWQADPVAATAVPLMNALLVVDEAVIAPATVFANTDRTGQSDEANAELAIWYAIHRAVAQADRAAATRILLDAERRYPGAGSQLRAIARYLDLLLDRVPAPLDAPAPDADDRGYAPHAVDVAVDIARGDTASARARMERHDVTGELFAHHGDVCRCLALVLDGEVGQGAALAAAGFAAAQREWDPVAFQAYGFALALTMAIQGHITQLDEVASHVLTMTSVSPLQGQYRVGVAGLAAARSRWFGLPRQVAGSIRRDDPAGDRLGPLPYMPAVPDPATGDALWRAAEGAAERGYVAAAAFAVVEAAEAAPDAERFARLEPALAVASSPLLRALTELGGAMSRRDHARLAELTQLFEEHGAWLFAARAGIQSVLALREAGELAAAAARADELWARITPVARGTAGLFTAISRSLELSPRESQIAEFVARGWATVDIANALVLSARTVEHHVLNTYRKVGVDSRDGLRLAFATWLRPEHTYGAWA